MLEVMNAGSTDLSQPESAIILNCWKKASTPLIKELEQTVSFAERKCGDLMQQLHFYKEYYEKWVHAGRLNQSLCHKKTTRSCCKKNQDVCSSSENEFEKVNQCFYKKIKNKISEMNQEITQANRKIHDASKSKKDLDSKAQFQMTPLENLDSKSLENKTKSEPVVNAFKEEKHASGPGGDAGTETQNGIKVTDKQSSKSVPLKSKESRIKYYTPAKRRFSNLQRYKLRSKSLPQGVKRKFGFGGFVDVIDPKANFENSRSKSRASLKVDTYRSFKTFKSDGQVKKQMNDAGNKLFGKFRRNQSASARSLQLRTSKGKFNAKFKESTNDYFSKNLQADSNADAKPGSKVGSKVGEKLNQTRSITSQSNIGLNATSNCSYKEPMFSTSSVKSSVADSNTGNIKHLMSKPNALIPFFRQPIPFIPCSSTSKTFNLGLNVQQVLSMIKHRRHSITLQAVIKNGMRATRSIAGKLEPTVNTLFFSHTTTSHSQVTSALCPARTCMEDAFSIVTDDIGCRSSCTLLKRAQAMRSSEFEENKKDENAGGEMKINEITKLERPEDVWVVEQSDGKSKDCKKAKSKCTCFPSKHCVDYHKVLREYTGWKMNCNKASFLNSDGYSSYQPLVTYQKPKLRAIPSQEDVNWNIEETDGKTELIKIYNDMMNLNRKYLILEEQIIQGNLDEYDTNAELDAMESELTTKEMEFKDVMSFYQQLMQLKEKLKVLRQKTVTSAIQPAQRPKKDPLRPTPSMALTKVLRKIQGLQDKIKLIDAP